VTWKLAGIAAISARSAEVSLGSAAGTTLEGRVPLLLTTLQPANVWPLGFAVVGLVEAGNVRSFGSERYYPQREPTLVNLGPGVSSSYSGRIVLRPRGYNRRWLESGYPAPVWIVRAAVYDNGANTAPTFTPNSFTLDGVEAVRDGDASNSNQPRGLKINE